MFVISNVHSSEDGSNWNWKYLGGEKCRFYEFIPSKSQMTHKIAQSAGGAVEYTNCISAEG